MDKDIGLAIKECLGYSDEEVWLHLEYGMEIFRRHLLEHFSEDVKNKYKH